MARIAVVTESSGCLPHEISKALNIHVAPIHIFWGRDEYRDEVDMTAKEFYARIRQLGENDKLPTTSGAVQGEFLQIFESLRGKVDGVVVPVLAGALSAGYSSAMSAKEMVPELPIEVIDTRTCMTALGLLVIATARVAASGADMAQVTKTARDLIPKVHCYWAMETVEYVSHGGRMKVPPDQLAEWLEVKPLARFSPEGKIEPVARPRGMPEAIDFMLNRVRDLGTEGPLHVGIIHGDVPEQAERLKEMVVAQFHPAELWVSLLTPVVGAHMGPGTIGLGFYRG